jgi:hypothetical protein
MLKRGKVNSSDFPETDDDLESDCAEELALFDLTESRSDNFASE